MNRLLAALRQLNDASGSPPRPENAAAQGSPPSAGDLPQTANSNMNEGAKDGESAAPNSSSPGQIANAADTASTPPAPPVAQSSSLIQHTETLSAERQPGRDAQRTIPLADLRVEKEWISPAPSDPKQVPLLEVFEDEIQVLTTLIEIVDRGAMKTVAFISTEELSTRKRLVASLARFFAASHKQRVLIVAPHSAHEEYTHHLGPPGDQLTPKNPIRSGPSKGIAVEEYSTAITDVSLAIIRWDRIQGQGTALDATVKGLLNAFGKVFDLLLIDASIACRGECVTLASFAEGCVLLSEERRAQSGETRSAIQTMKANRCNIVGTVLVELQP